MVTQELPKEANHIYVMQKVSDLDAGEWQCIHCPVHVIR